MINRQLRNLLLSQKRGGVLMTRQYQTASFEEIMKSRSFSSATSNMEKELLLYSKKKQAPVSLKTLMDSGRGDNANLPLGSIHADGLKPSDKIIMQIACFLHRELPVRLAHRAVKLEGSQLFTKSGKSMFEMLAR
jgi:hypothetical protein